MSERAETMIRAAPPGPPQRVEDRHHLADALVKEDRLALGVLGGGIVDDLRHRREPLGHAVEQALALRREAEEP